MTMNCSGARVDVERPIRGIAVVKAEYWARSVVGGNEDSMHVRSLTCCLGGEMTELGGRLDGGLMEGTAVLVFD